MSLKLDVPGACLRAPRDSDVEALVRHANDAQVSRNMRDAFPFPYGPDNARWFIQHAVAPGAGRLYVIDVEGEAVGATGLHPLQDVYACGVELGYWLGRAFWGRGLASAAVKVMAPLAFEDPAIERVEAGVFGFNPASARVLEKNGFVLEGRHRRAARKRGELTDVLLYARLRDPA